MGKYGTPALVRFHIHLLQAVPWPFPSQSHSTLAVFPAIRCRCCRSSRSSPSGRHLWYGFLVRSLSTLAAYPVIQCRCGKRSCLTAVIIAVVVTILMIAPCLLSSVRIYTHFVGIYCHFAQSSMLSGCIVFIVSYLNSAVCWIPCILPQNRHFIPSPTVADF